MNYSDLLPDKDTAQQREAVEAGCGRGLVVHHLQGQVVNLQSIGQVPDSLPVAVGVGGNYNFMSLFNQALRKLINVAFYATHIWIEKVRHHADVVLPVADPGDIYRVSLR